jgi:3-oxo-5alpha-steroid 4-dehydrogenase
VPFEGSLCPDKTSYPTNRHYLYYSGSEVSARALAHPAPRGHRTRGRGTSGGLLSPGSPLPPGGRACG